ncbi:acetate/propionate family kinase [Billgrantia montanilacus]|uniref:Acetate kinase n=1 Tax=Billgrantia montanilacus TaxID=2282305 RepID=A0A368TPZ1_9GAMM|nr:acetate/propionate family kinase [Halomonas montanilacus]RCV86795.1 acetate/propionate family kinase [Halomonas montanilacus]
MREILVINSGSSSIKFALFGAVPEAEPKDLQLRYRGHFAGLGSQARLSLKDGEGGSLDPGLAGPALSDVPADLDHDGALSKLLAWIEAHPNLGDIGAVGHRIVHGGSDHVEPIRLDTGVLDALEALVPLAPLHQPYGLAPVRALAALRPDLPQVACFDTAFHAEQPSVARTFPLPRRYRDAGVIRYGFHGLSYDYINRTLNDRIQPTHGGEAKAGRVIVAHLGNGASLCAIRDGKSIASTMGFTAVEGLMMGTRSGSLDPGLVLHLIRQEGMAAEAVERLLYKESGLLGVSGISGDMRELLQSDAPEAAEAIELFVYRIVSEIGSLAAALGGLDHLVFTAGIGERAAPVRAAVVEGCEWLGAVLDSASNQADATSIAAVNSRMGLWVIPTDEERMIGWYTAAELFR